MRNNSIASARSIKSEGWSWATSSRIVLVLTGLWVLVMPLTEYLWHFDNFFRGGDDLELELFSVAMAVCLPNVVIDEISSPPSSPEECIFARTTQTVSADLTTQITPCQFGGDPDCSQCGCIASMGLAAVGHHKLIGGLTAGHLFMASDRVGKQWRKVRKSSSPKPVTPANAIPFKILSN